MTPEQTGPARIDDDDDVLMTRQEASAFLVAFGIRLKPASLARIWSVGGDGPPCRHVRGKPYYPRRFLQAWAQSQVSDLRYGAPAAARGRRRG